MPIHQDTFAVGTVVTWRNDDMAERTDGRKRFGDTLTIVEVRPVTCSFRSVGHTQHVRIDKSNDPTEWFSGAYFKHPEAIDA